MGKIIKAVAGILIRDNSVLLASRPKHKLYSGFWEFPGGKVEAGETIVQALIRELAEEIGIRVKNQDCTHMQLLNQGYSYTKVYLDVIKVYNWQGEPHPLEGQMIYWQHIYEDCLKKPLLPTTKKILALIREQDNL